MDHQDRQQILNNLDLLERGIHNFDVVFEMLVSKEVFNEYMKNEILAHPNKVRYFFQYVTTRGPNAFKQLVRVMNETDNGHMAALLVDRKTSTWRMVQQGCGGNRLALDEEYPHDPDIEWVVRKGIERYDFDVETVYKMGSNPKGLMLIINVRNFVNGTKEERFGSEHDIRRLRETFVQVGYKVIEEVRDKLKADDILKCVRDFAQRSEHWKCDSCIVVMMSHGTFSPGTTQSVNFYGYDLKTVNSEDIIKEFHGHKCRALVGKPKIFFFQACRGDQLNFTVPRIFDNDQDSQLVKKDNDKENEFTRTGVQKKHDIEPDIEKSSTQIHPLSENYIDNNQASENNSEYQLISGNGCENQVMNGNNCENQVTNGNNCETQLVTDSNLVSRAVSEDSRATGDRIRVDADIFIGYSTTPGNVSRRDPDTGSWFIQILCQMIAKHSWNKDISTILDHTDGEIKKKTDCGTVQSIEVVNILTKKFYTQPGIYHD